MEKKPTHKRTKNTKQEQEQPRGRPVQTSSPDKIHTRENNTETYCYLLHCVYTAFSYSREISRVTAYTVIFASRQDLRHKKSSPALHKHFSRRAGGGQTSPRDTAFEATDPGTERTTSCGFMAPSPPGFSGPSTPLAPGLLSAAPLSSVLIVNKYWFMAE